MKRTTKIIYCRNGQCGMQYAPNNVSPYGTTWRLQLQQDENGRYTQIGLPHLLLSNWTIDEKKLKETADFYAKMM